jgi:glutamyl endopeptidase
MSRRELLTNIEQESTAINGIQDVSNLARIVFRPYSIFGENTIVVAPPPIEFVCHLKITTINDTVLTGTGFFISEKCILTAGHCVFDSAHGGWMKSVEVSRPGMQSATCTATHFRSISEWTINKFSDRDYGAVILGDDEVVALGVKSFPILERLARIENLDLKLFGYIANSGSAEQHMSQGKAIKLTPNRILHYIDTLPGFSGAPLMYEENGQWKVVGIHNYGVDDLDVVNKAVRVNDSLISLVAYWKTL